MRHESEQVKGGNVVDVRNRSEVSEAMVHEIHRVITQAMTSQTMEIGQYVLDSVFQGGRRRALSAAPHGPIAVGKLSQRQSGRGRGVQAHRIRRIKQP